MSDKKKICDWEFGLFERAWGRRGVACPDCVNESNHKVWRRFLDRAVPKIDYVPKGLTVDLEEAYAEYFKQEVEFRHGNSIATDKG